MADRRAEAGRIPARRAELPERASVPRRPPDATCTPATPLEALARSIATSPILQTRAVDRAKLLADRPAPPLAAVIQRWAARQVPPAPTRANLPSAIRARAEAASGLALDDVTVHYNSPAPATIQAHAYAEGTDIHLGPGQEKHLPHEAWHVVQQKQGRVRPTATVGGVALNDDARLEREADAAPIGSGALPPRTPSFAYPPAIQRVTIKDPGYVMKTWKDFQKRYSETYNTDYVFGDGETTYMDEALKQMTSFRFETFDEFLHHYDQMHSPDPGIMHGGYQATSNARIRRSDSMDHIADYDGTKDVKNLRQENVKLWSRQRSSENQIKMSITIQYRVDLDDARSLFADKTWYINQFWISGLHTAFTNHDGNSEYLKGLQFGHLKDGVMDSEISLATDPKQSAYFQKGIERLIGQVGFDVDRKTTKRFVVLSFILGVDSYPYTMCMRGCRYAMDDVFSNFDAISRGYDRLLDRMHGHYSSAFANTLRISSEDQYRPEANVKLRDYVQSPGPDNASVPQKGQNAKYEMMPAGVHFGQQRSMSTAFNERRGKKRKRQDDRSDRRS